MLRERSEALTERSARREVAQLVAEPAAAEPAARDTLTDPLIGRVLTAWRDHDAQGTQAPSGEVVESPEQPEPVVAAARAVEPAGDLELTELDGIDAELGAQLERVGVCTLEELRDADALALAGIVGYTRMRHLQFLARRALRSRALQSPTDVLVPRAPPAERRAGTPREPVGVEAPVAPLGRPLASLRFSPALLPQAPSGQDLEVELERFAREARAALERDFSGAPLTDEGGSGPFA